MTKTTKKRGPKPIHIVLPPLRVGRVRFDIESDTPMLLHGFHQTSSCVGLTGEGRFRSAIKPYLAPGSTNTKPKIQLPGVWFKMMLVNAVRQNISSIRRNSVSGFCHIEEDYVVLKHSPIKRRRDVVALPPYTRNLVAFYRGQIDTWSCSFTVRYNRDLIDKRGLITLVEAGGLATGLGAWRPQIDGFFGQFQLRRATALRGKAARRRAA